MLYEIRSYHYEPTKFDDYKAWAVEDAVPFLREHLNLIGFWVDSGDQVEMAGSAPMSLPLGSSNITWILCWKDMDDRNAGHKRVFKGEGWKKIWSKHPDPDGYLQMEAKFAEAL